MFHNLYMQSHHNTNYQRPKIEDSIFKTNITDRSGHQLELVLLCLMLPSLLGDRKVVEGYDIAH